MMHGPIHIKFTIPKFLKQCLFILLVKIGWKQGKALGSKAGNSVVESIRLGLCAIGNNLDIWTKFVFLGRHLEGTLISLWVLRFGGYYQVNFGRAALKSFKVKWILWTHSVFTPGESENHRKIVSIWNVTVPSRCMLTSSQYTSFESRENWSVIQMSNWISCTSNYSIKGKINLKIINMNFI